MSASRVRRVSSRSSLEVGDVALDDDAGRQLGRHALGLVVLGAPADVEGPVAGAGPRVLPAVLLGHAHHLVGRPLGRLGPRRAAPVHDVRLVAAGGAPGRPEARGPEGLMRAAAARAAVAVVDRGALHRVALVRRLAEHGLRECTAVSWSFVRGFF